MKGNCIQCYREDRNFALTLCMPADLKFIKINFFFMNTAFSEMLFIFFIFSSIKSEYLKGCGLNF